ncbi:MAG: porin [Sideroxydans sp.]|nr:porin [Sideroxydans sp.]
MQKKLIALAVAAALTAPALALADSANVSVYGVVDADVELVKSDKVAATAPGSRGRVTSNASRLGVKGEENVGNGLTAFFQAETRVNLMGNEFATTSNAGGGTTQTNLGVFNGMRNSNLGLKGDFGTAFIGNWDTPFKVAHNKVELFDNTSIATNTALLGAGPAKFNLRQNSSVQYWSPVMSGFQVKGAYSTVNATVENPTAGAGANAANNLGTPNLMSFSAAYDQDGIYVALATEQHKNFSVTATTTGSKESANRLVAAYSLDAMQVGVTYESMTATTTAGVDTKKNTFALSGKYAMGANNFGLSYTQAGDNSGAANVNTGAKQISLRYGYAMTKRSEVYGMYTQLANKAAGTYNFVDVAPLASTAGATLSGFGVGVRHSF